jgi:hypothetical protein|tara:strand:- start:1997 stop:2404 length:408 start_codon:yes stop_codon:yes gene_type:complete
MTRFIDPKKLEAHLQKAIEDTLKNTVVKTQDKLGDDAPFFTGMMKSSWFAGDGSPSRAVPTEGSKTARTDARELDVKLGRNYYLSSNLPYSQRVCLTDDWPGKTASKDWFRKIRDFDVDRLFNESAKEAKAKFDL